MGTGAIRHRRREGEKGIDERVFPRAKRPTIRDVAAAANVSKSLVSLLYAGGTVSPERRARILNAAQELGFRPNMTARSLSTAGGDFTGILVVDFHNPVFAEIVDAAREKLAQTGRSALMTSAVMPDAVGSPKLDQSALAIFGDLRPRSILVVGSVPGMHELTAFTHNIPIVMASAVADDLPVAATVRSDDDQGMRLVVDHLVELGHRRIAHIGGEGGLVADRRSAAYVAAMTAHGLAEYICIEASDYSEGAGFAATQRLLSRSESPTAIASINDLAAVGALAALTDRDPGSSPIAVTGYDNTSVARLRQVSITSVEPGNRQIGIEAATRIAEVESGRTPVDAEVLITPTLITRASTVGT